MKAENILIFYFIVYICFQTVLCLQLDTDFSNEWLLQADFDIHEAREYAKLYGLDAITEVFPKTFVIIGHSVPRLSKKQTTFRKRISTLNGKVHRFEQQRWHNVSLRSITVNDPLWSQMWYMNRNDAISMRIKESWESGYSGHGVNVAVVDDGVELDHPDLLDRYDSTYSWDAYDNNDDPSPAAGDRHGTNCAGVALATNNTVCVIGAAFLAKLIGVRLIGPLGVTDTGKITAFSNKGTDISSNSWGGTENTFDGPSAVVKEALKYGAENGRGGLGVIYVFSGGNGGFNDNCNMDGYINNIYTIAINSVSRSFQPPGYAEPCPAILASSFSGPGGQSDNICSTDLNKACMTSFSGTSAAAAMTSGVLALVLEANPYLTWRDVQEIIILTSKSTGLVNGDFKTNAVGRNVSDWFGYGLLDTEAMIFEALNWTCLEEQHTCSSESVTVNKQIVASIFPRTVESTISTTGCNGTENCVDRVEHVEVRVTFQASLRGAVILFLRSPMGYTSQLLTRRNNDRITMTSHTWTYMSVQHWGEYPLGNWTLTMSLEQDWRESGTLISWSLILYGTGSSCTPLTIQTTTLSSKTTVHYTTKLNSTCSVGHPQSTRGQLEVNLKDPVCNTLCIIIICACAGLLLIVTLACTLSRLQRGKCNRKKVESLQAQ